MRPFWRRRQRPPVMGFWDHVGELRTRLIWSVVAIAVGTIVGLIVYDWLLSEVFLPPYCRVLESQQIDRPCTLVITSPLEGFRTRIKVSAYLGIVVAMPVLLWHLWRFITPALDRREKKWAVPFVLAAFLLFASGAALAYFTFERALEFLIAVSGDAVEPLLGPGSYLGLVTFMMIAFGIGFEFPIVLVFMQLAGIVTPRQLNRARRYAIVGIVAGAAIITPSGDPISLAALSVPLYIFYELSILVGHLLTRRRRGWQPRRLRRQAQVSAASDAPENAADAGS
ncbi:twin-arginine translocase subunit TatC [Candidatus Poriferisodalis sp.]|uniref:twin-arginine translocase subunit TatC n=1 Tax=Candidatus Poriferisodalis sp. TaxID=3101277 RepID=UPI003D0C9CED